MINFNISSLPLEIFIGYTGENIFRSFAFDVTEWKKKYPEGVVSISFRRPDQTTGYPVVVNSSENPVIWTVTKADVSVPGKGEIVLRLSENEVIGKTFSIPTITKASPDFTGDPPDPFPDWLSDILEVETRIADDVQEVSTNTQTVATNTQIAIDKAAEALQSAANALVSEQNAHASAVNAEDSNQSALTAMRTAVQAMTDLLAMLGEDIATLTGGKLTPSQIPTIAITDTFVVATEEAMLALDCETGDICIRTDENKTYILQGTDPSILSDWQQLKTPTNYADEAGHAATSDNAENANKINNKRLVAMTESQYDVAAKDPDTLYVVVPDEE